MKTSATKEPAVIVHGDVRTAYGNGLDALWDGLHTGITAAKPVEHFSTQVFPYHQAACIPNLPTTNQSRVMHLLAPLLSSVARDVTPNTLLILATTTGEIDLLEQAIENQTGKSDFSLLQNLLDKVARQCGTKKKLLLSSACASSTAAIAHAAALIQSQREERVLIVACDAVSEFVFSGFSALRALAVEPAKPFDEHRDGLLLGEAAGTLLLMSEFCAQREKRPSLGTITGWGLSNDANHMTGPSRTGHGLQQAIHHAYRIAQAEPTATNFICAHGTGTVYNDTMEMHAFHAIYNAPKPLYSIKGGTGHTMGAAGLVETLTVLRALREKQIPPTIGLQQVDPLAAGWVNTQSTPILPGTNALTTNSGFGGINAALLLTH